MNEENGPAVIFMSMSNKMMSPEFNNLCKAETVADFHWLINVSLKPEVFISVLFKAYCKLVFNKEYCRYWDPSFT